MAMMAICTGWLLGRYPEQTCCRLLLTAALPSFLQHLHHGTASTTQRLAKQATARGTSWRMPSRRAAAAWSRKLSGRPANRLWEGGTNRQQGLVM
jgi:hypothetical protein